MEKWVSSQMHPNSSDLGEFFSQSIVLSDVSKKKNDTFEFTRKQEMIGQNNDVS
jgi:hypothetical protein